MAAVQALEVRHKTRMGELEGEVRGLQEREAAKQATLATTLQESQLREQVCTTTPVVCTCPNSIDCAAGMQTLATHYKAYTCYSQTCNPVPCTQT